MAWFYINYGVIRPDEIFNKKIGDGEEIEIKDDGILIRNFFLIFDFTQ